MKIDKRDPAHWWALVRGGVNMMGAIALRRVSGRRNDAIIFYGHTLNGNLHALAAHLQAHGSQECYFATLDPAYARELAADPEAPARPLNLMRIRDTVKVARSGAVVSDRHTHVLEYLNRFTDLPFIDVWHGIPYKGFTARDFGYLRHYDEVWVSSPTMAGVYTERWGVEPSRVRVTGYARTDALVEGRHHVGALREKYGIGDEYRKVVLVAPTWKQDHVGRSIIPFGASEQEFFQRLNAMGEQEDALVIFRAHLNVPGGQQGEALPHLRAMPYSTHPQTEEFLALADVLVTDWSSIAFDYVALRRPMVFLDVPPPFDAGLTLGPEHRPGDVVASLEDGVAAVASALRDPESFLERHREQMDATIEAAYGDQLDGQAASRQRERLLTMLGRQA